MKKIIEDFEKKYPKNIGLNIEFNPDLEIKTNEMLENRYLFATSDLAEIKILTVRNNGEYASRNINQAQLKKELEQHFFPQIINEWGLKNENELDNLSKKIQEQEQKIEELKSDNVKSNDSKIEPKKEKDDTDFLKKIYQFKSNLSPNIGLINDAFEQNLKKAEKIETDIKDLKNNSKKIDSKINDLTDTSLSQTQKDKLFAELERDILNLKLAVDKLKEQNQTLKKELELLVEKNKIESQKSGLEKENSTLKDKIEALKNKTQNSKTEFQEKTTENKITYKESQLIKDYENLNDNQKEK